MAAKIARLEARLTRENQLLIREAAALRGQSMTDFVVAVSLSEARKVVAENDAIQLSRAEQARFIEAILNPKPLTKALRRAAAAHRELIER